MQPKLAKHIDLHGLTVQQGYNKTTMFIRLHHNAQSPYCKVVTGRSGKMRREFDGWISGHLKRFVASVKEFDDHGSFLIKLADKPKP